MNRLWACALVLTLGGCTCLFDPALVPQPDSGANGCPNSAAGCPGLANTTATCNGDVCAYACAAGFVDVNGDLADGGSTGCERDCRNVAVPTNPSRVVATVGIPGTVDLTWTESTPPSEAYRICLGPPANTCVVATASAACNGPACGVQLTGLPNNARITTRVTGFDSCGQEGPAGSALSVSYTPMNSFAVNGDGFDLDSTCGPTVSATTSQEILVDQTGAFCLSTLALGDELWGDATAQVDIFFPAAATSPLYSGIGVQLDSPGHAVAAGFTVADTARTTSFLYRPSAAVSPLTGATSIYKFPVATWTTARVVASRGVFSLQAGAPGSTLTEVLRWPSPLASAPTQTGRPGLFVYGTGKVQFRNFRVSTASTLPTNGATSVQYNLNAPPLPSSWRLVGGPSRRIWSPCPAASTDAGTCAVDGGCGPVGPGCVHLTNYSAALFADPGMAFFDLPVGIDVARPWSWSMRFLAVDGGNNNPMVVGTGGGPLLSVNGGVAGPVQSTTVSLGVPLVYDVWNHAAWRFVPDAGSIELRLNGGLPVAVPFPPGWDRHPGAIQLGGGVGPFGFGLFEGYITDINVSQP